MASLTAAPPRSCSISVSVAAAGSITTDTTFCVPVATTRTAPPPALASTVSPSSSVWTLAMRSCLGGSRPGPPCVPGPCGPASAGPAAASSSGPSFGDLLDASHPPVEPAHHLADERVVLGAGRRLAARLARLGGRLTKPELDLHLVSKPCAHERQQDRPLAPRLPVGGPGA